MPRDQVFVLSYGHYAVAGGAFRRFGTGRQGKRGGYAVAVLRERSDAGDERALRDRVYPLYHDLFSLRFRHCRRGARIRLETRLCKRGGADGARVRYIVRRIRAALVRRGARRGFVGGIAACGARLSHFQSDQST